VVTGASLIWKKFWAIVTTIFITLIYDGVLTIVFWIIGDFLLAGAYLSTLIACAICGSIMTVLYCIYGNILGSKKAQHIEKEGSSNHQEISPQMRNIIYPASIPCHNQQHDELNNFRIS